MRYGRSAGIRLSKMTDCVDSPGAVTAAPGMIHARPQLSRSWAKRPARRSASGEEGLDDQRQDAGDDDAVHPLQQVDLGVDDRELLVERGDVLRVRSIWSCMFGSRPVCSSIRSNRSDPTTRLSAAARASTSCSDRSLNCRPCGKPGIIGPAPSLCRCGRRPARSRLRSRACAGRSKVTAGGEV
jgi:hypothetical protein